MPTIKDIAERTGLGVATISSYLNGGNVRARNRLLIEKAIQELHYVVNETARGLKTNRTRMIGAVIPELNSSFCAQVLSRVEDILRRHGYGLLVCDCRTDAVREREAIDFLLRRRVDGLFSIPVDRSGKNLEDFMREGHPLVLLDRKIAGLDCDSVGVNNREAMGLAVEALAEAGHERIGLLAGPRDVFTAEERRKGYLAACRELGLPVRSEWVYQDEDSIESGVRGIETLLAGKEEEPVTAVVSASSSMTMGSIIGINEMGLEIPGDVSVIGFDNPQFARALSPRLTIVSQPVEEIGCRAAELMLARLEQDPDKIEKRADIRLDARLIPGKTIAAWGRK